MKYNALYTLHDSLGNFARLRSGSDARDGDDARVRIFLDIHHTKNDSENVHNNGSSRANVWTHKGSEERNKG